MWGRKAMAKLAARSATQAAAGVSKENFLTQLKAAWSPYVKKRTSIEAELVAAMERVNSSPFKNAFDKVGIAESDIRTILEEIREEKVDPIVYEQAKVGRNEPCPCGSDKKYKHCCGR